MSETYFKTLERNWYAIVLYKQCIIVNIQQLKTKSCHKDTTSFFLLNAAYILIVCLESW